MALADLPDFIADHRPAGPLTGDASEPTGNGYMVTVGCVCGVVFMRWVTAVDAVENAIHERLYRL